MWERLKEVLVILIIMISLASAADSAWGGQFLAILPETSGQHYMHLRPELVNRQVCYFFLK